MAYILPDDMRIGVNLLFMIPGEVGGSEPYVTNLVRALAKEDLDLCIFAVRGFSDAYPDIAAACEVVAPPWSQRGQTTRIAAEQTWLQYEGRRRKISLLHHCGGTSPFINLGRSVLTIHDIQYRHYPQNFVKPKRWWLKMNVPVAVKASDVTCVVSQWVKNDLVDKLGTDPSKIFVVPFGSEGLVGTADPQEIRRRHNLDRPFVFYPSRTYPHKNHLFLIEAFAPLADTLDLVLTGPAWFRDPLVSQTAERLGISSSVRHLGQVTRDDLASLYSASEALVYPSMFEGFGAPLLEAMSVGCPVIASNVCSIPEVVGDAGILLDPRDHDAWRSAIRRVVDDGPDRDLLISRGHSRAARFQWEASASAQIAAYQRALA